jgi:hypothetical protein
MEKECCICFNEIWLTLTPCKHTICLDCLFKLKKDQCPICRSNILTILPDNIQKLLNISTKKYNIYDQDEFPTLDSHPFGT